MVRSIQQTYLPYRICMPGMFFPIDELFLFKSFMRTELRQRPPMQWKRGEELHDHRRQLHGGDWLDPYVLRLWSVFWIVFGDSNALSKTIADFFLFLSEQVSRRIWGVLTRWTNSWAQMDSPLLSARCISTHNALRSGFLRIHLSSIIVYSRNYLQLVLHHIYTPSLQPFILPSPKYPWSVDGAGPVSFHFILSCNLLVGSSSMLRIYIHHHGIFSIFEMTAVATIDLCNLSLF